VSGAGLDRFTAGRVQQPDMMAVRRTSGRQRWKRKLWASAVSRRGLQHLRPILPLDLTRIFAVWGEWTEETERNGIWESRHSSIHRKLNILPLGLSWESVSSFPNRLSLHRPLWPKIRGRRFGRGLANRRLREER
jgi:hypothetical protein